MKKRSNKIITISLMLSLILVSFQVCYSQDITTGLQGYWKFETNLNDETPNTNSAVIHGSGMTYVPHSNSCGNTAIAFDNAGGWPDSYLTIPNNNAYSFGTGAFTVAMEIQYTSPQPWTNNDAGSMNNGNYASITDKIDPGCPQGWNGINMFLDYSPPGNYGIAQGRTQATDPYAINTVNTTLSDGTWHCLVFTREPDQGGTTCTLKMYIDGTLNNSSAGVLLNDVTNATDIFIGRNSCQTAVQNYRGLLDNYRLYNRALTAADIQSLCNCPIVNSCPGNMILNGGFTNGFTGVSSGNLGNGATLSNWSAATNTPQVFYTTGCQDTGYIRMWGMPAGAESIQQVLPAATRIIEGHLYNVSYCARWDSGQTKAGAPQFAQFLFRASNNTLNNNTETNQPPAQSIIHKSAQLTNVNNWITYQAPTCWVADADYSRLTISATNNSTVNHPDSISWGEIDNICLTECPCNVVAAAGPDTSSCTGQPITLNAATGPGFTYEWKKVGSATVIGIQPALTVSPTTSTCYVLKVTASGGCYRKDTVCITVWPVKPVMPNSISGLSKACPGDTICYSVAAVARATHYTWTLPGATIISGDGTNTVCFKVEPGFSGGTLSVTADNACGSSSTARTKTISLNAAGQPGTITGPSSFCPGDTVCFSTATVANAKSYIWTAPLGMTVLSGAGTNTICYIVEQNYNGGTITVSSVNGCGTSAASTKTVTRNIPATPSVIAGLTKFCPGDTVCFSITTIANATNYTWVPPAGLTPLSGSGTNTICYIVGPGYTGGTLSVTATNNCGSGPARTLTVYLNSRPGTPGVITGPASFCPGDTVCFSIAAVSTATYYNWVAPPGMQVLSGAGTNTICYIVDGTYTGGTLSLTANNKCGSGSARTKPVTRNAVPAIPGNITGPVSFCPGDTVCFSIAPVANATGYTWHVPTGMIIISGNGTTTICCVVDANYNGGIVAVSADNRCGSSASRIKNVARNTPALPGSISGPAAFCPDDTVCFSITPVLYATGYEWHVPPGTTIISGDGTTTICCIVDAGYTAGIIGVSANNRCGSSPTRILNVTRGSSPSTPGAISGPAKFCPGDTVCFSITPVTNAKNYVWTIPPGMTIISGQGTTQVCCVVGASYTGGTVSVATANGCGQSTARTKSVSRNIPAIPSAITGITGICIGDTVCYSVTVVSGATNYTWTAPTGMIAINGQGTTVICYIVAEGFTGGTLSVTANNGCGASTSRTLKLTLRGHRPLIPGPISGPATICTATSYFYNINMVQYADTYTWLGSAGLLIYGSNAPLTTTALSVAASSGTISSDQTIMVRSNNICGSSPYRILAGIDIIQCFAKKISPNEPKNRAPKEMVASQEKITVYPNPVNGIATLSFSSLIKEKGKLFVTDQTGRIILNYEISINKGSNVHKIDLRNFTNGVYILTLKRSGVNEVVRIFKE